MRYRRKRITALWCFVSASALSAPPPFPGRLCELSAWGSVLSALSALSALEDLSYIVSELGVGLHWERRVSYIISDKKQGGGSLEVTTQDINAERHY